MIPCRNYHLTWNIIMQRMTSGTSHFIFDNLFAIFVHYKGFFVINHCVTDTNTSQMIYLTNIIDHDSLFMVNLLTNCLLLDVPKVNCVLVSSYPLLEQSKKPYFFALVFWNGFLCLKVVGSLPKCDANPIDDGSNSLMRLVKVHRENCNLPLHVFVSFRYDLMGHLF